MAVIGHSKHDSPRPAQIRPVYCAVDQASPGEAAGWQDPYRRDVSSWCSLTMSHSILTSTGRHINKTQ